MWTAATGHLVRQFKLGQFVVIPHKQTPADEEKTHYIQTCEIEKFGPFQIH